MKFDAMDSVEETDNVGSICAKGSSLCCGEWEVLGLSFGCDGLLEDVDGWRPRGH